MPSEITIGQVTESTRQRIYRNLCNAERNARYYEALAGKYRLRHRLLRGLLLVSVLVEAALIQRYTDPLIIGAGVLVIVLLVVWEAISDYAKNAALLSSMSADCLTLNYEWDELWLDAESYAVSEAAARSRRRQLISEFDSIERRIEISLDEGLASRSAQAATEAMEEKYGREPVI